MYTVTVTIDTRERVPLPFPEQVQMHQRRSKTPTLIRVKTESVRMPEGDYAIKGFEHECLIETKRSAREVGTNLLDADFRRSSSAFERLCTNTAHPYLVCEFAQSALYSHDEYPRIVDALTWCTARYGLNVWFAGPRSGKDSRRQTAESVLRIMLAHVELASPNFFHGE